MNDAINIPGAGQIPHLDNDYKLFLNYTSIFYGLSGTGKSFCIKDIMNRLKNYIPNIIIIAPTGESTQDYKGIVPHAVIHTEIDLELLRNIWLRQEASTHVYNRVNDITNLRKFFMRINNSAAVEGIRRLTSLLQQRIQAVNLSNVPNKLEQTMELQRIFDEKTKDIYKNTIRAFGAKIPNLTTEESEILKYIDLNPNLLLIADDCQAQIAEWCADPVISKLFMQGRHNSITTFITLQSPNGKPQLSPAIRQQTFNTIFTTFEVATIYFNDKNNGFPTEFRKHVQRVISHLFRNNPDGTKNHKKLIYQRHNPKNKLSYIIAKHNPDLKFGSKTLWDYCERLPIDKKKTTNKFTAKFAV